MSYSLTNLGSNITAINGNVGIGTNNPFSRLHLHNSGTAQDVRMILSDGTTGASATDGFQMIKGTDGLCSLWNYENRDLRIGTSNYEVMRAYNSNIGIGTNVATYKLDVNGTVNASEYRLNGTVFTGGSGGTTSGYSSQWANFNNAIAWYKLNGNLNDSSGNNSNISYIGSTLQYDNTDYKVSFSSIVFSGNNYLKIQNNGNFSPDNFTIMFWLYYIQDPNYIRTVLASCYDFTGNPIRPGYYLYIDGANRRLYIWTNTVASADPIMYLFTSNNWYHIAITLNKSDGKINIYINGSYIVSRTHSYYNNNISYFYIGYESTWGIINQGNKMNDFRLYNRILNENEILYVYNKYNSYNSNIQEIYYTQGNVGIGTNNPVYTLDVRGNIYAQNSVYAGDDVVAGYSDIRLKNIVMNIENSLDMIDNINVFRYSPNSLAQSLDIRNNGLEIGVSAQDVQKVLPEVVRLAPFDTSNLDTGEVVSKSGQNYLTVKYERLVPLLIECIKDLKKENEQIREKIASLEFNNLNV